MRLFVALAPPPRVRDHLERALTSVRRVGGDGARPGLRWAPPGDRHITLAFFGEVPAGAAEELSGGLVRIGADHPRFDLRLRGAGVFDRRILWIGCGDDVRSLGALTARCVDLGQSVTGRQDHRVRSRAHLTVARVAGRARGRDRDRSRGRGGSNDLADLAALTRALAVYDGPTWQVTEVVLVSSRPGAGEGGGPAYEPLLGFALAGSEQQARGAVVAG
jgi:2'-5' RNA ligase